MADVVLTDGPYVAEPDRAVSEPGPAASGPDIHTTAGKFADLLRRHDEALHAGSTKAVEKRHALGKKTARERVDQLMDCLLYTSPSPRDRQKSRMPTSA